MKERPILFSAPMVRAILDGRKTVTRRAVKDTGLYAIDAAIHGEETARRELAALATRCPYGQPGDRLWVRETWGYIDPDNRGEMRDSPRADAEGPQAFAAELQQEGHPLREYWRRRVAYAASWQEPKFGVGPDAPTRWRPSIHMPRWASRILLEVTAVRVERLHEISDDDALAEGVDRTNTSIHGYAKERYMRLWESINGPGSWDANPWVWVVTFRVQP